MENKLETLVSGMGLELVEMVIAPGRVLQVFIDKPGAGVSVSDCESVSRQLDRFLAVEGFEYSRLEVSSPGLERPLKKITDYEKFVGKFAKVTIFDELKNKKRFETKIESVDLLKQSICFKMEDEQLIKVSFTQIEKARLIYKL